MRKVAKGGHKKTGPAAFVKLREQLGSREVVAPAMGTNRITLFRWETGVHPIPQWGVILVGLLVEKYPGGIPDQRAIELLRVAQRGSRPSSV